MASKYDWSLVAASNATSDSAINWAEGQAPSTVNGSARQMMARDAELLGDIGGALTAGGTADALTVTANSAFTTYANGRILALRIATDNTTAATLNVNGIGAKSIRKMVAAGETALVGAELQATGIYLLMYSEALNAAAGGWLLLNPTGDIAAASTTQAGAVELATDAEAIARSDTARAVTPSNLAAAIGPASSTDNAVARFDSTSGKLQNSATTISDSGDITVGGATPIVTIGSTSVSTGAAALEVGGGRAGNGVSHIDLHSQTGTDYESRIIRNSGANGSLEVINNGSGGIAITGNVTINGTLTVTG